VLASKVIMAKSNFIPSPYSSLTITVEFRNGGALAFHLGPACFSFNAPAFSYLAAHTDLTLEQDLDNTAGFPAVLLFFLWNSQLSEVPLEGGQYA